METCPTCNNELELENRSRYIMHNGEYHLITSEMYYCCLCDLEIGTAKQAGDIQKKLQGIINKRG